MSIYSKGRVTQVSLKPGKNIFLGILGDIKALKRLADRPVYGSV